MWKSDYNRLMQISRVNLLLLSFLLCPWNNYSAHSKHILLITLCNCLRTEDFNCCSFASGIFAHSWLYTKLELLNTPWSPLFDSPLHDAPYNFNRRQIWTAGRPVKHTHSMPTMPHCCNSCRMRPSIVLMK